MGFEPHIRRIVEQMEMPPPGARQTMLFSATFPTEIQRLASDIMSNYIFLAIGRVGSSTDLIVQKVEFVQDMDKRNYLMDLLHTQCDNGAHGKRQRGADALERWLSMNGFLATAIHVDKVQMARSLQSNKLGLHFRPEDPYSHPAFGELQPCNNFLLKITKKAVRNGQDAENTDRVSTCLSEDEIHLNQKSCTESVKNDQHVDECQIDSITAPTEVKAQLPEEVQEDISADIVARVSEAYYFNERRETGQIWNHNLKCGLMDVDQKDLMILVPPLFSIKDVPEKVVLHNTIFFPVEGFCLGHGKYDLFCLGHGKWMMDEFVAAGISKKLGIIGFCFGGGQLIDALTQDGGACFGIGGSFYGTRIDPSVVANIKVPVLFIVGDNDPSCLEHSVAAFTRVLDEASVVLLFRDKVCLHPDKLVLDKWRNMGISTTAHSSKEKIRIPKVKAITTGPLTNGQNSVSASLIDDDKDGKTAPRWMHLDPCEGIYDNPLLYEKGWKKNLNYVIAFAKDGVYDVTKRYNRKWHEVLSRRNITTEPILSIILSNIRRECRQNFASQVISALEDQDRNEAEALERELHSKDDASISLPGRQSELTRRTSINPVSNGAQHLFLQMLPSFDQLFDALSLKSELDASGRVDIYLVADPVRTSIALPVLFHALDDVIHNVNMCNNFNKNSLSWPLQKLNRIYSGLVLASGEELSFGIVTSAFDGTRMSKWEEPNGAKEVKVLGNETESVSFDLRPSDAINIAVICKDRPKTLFEEWLMMDEFVAAGISKKLGIIGFCFGGGRLIDALAQEGGACFGIGVSFYGTRIDPYVVANIKVPILFIVGDNDPSCPAVPWRERSNIAEVITKFAQLTAQERTKRKRRITLLGEGCRGSLSEKIMKKYNLREKVQGQHQTYTLGIKEVWEIDSSKHEPGHVLHTLGWPLDNKTYGGSFLHHMKDRQVSLGLVVALNYHNPFLNPYEEFQKLKHHPAIKPLLEGATVLQYGARTLNEGGFQLFPGGAIIGCSAGFLNVRKIKGTHTAMKSGCSCYENGIGCNCHIPAIFLHAALSVLLATLARLGGTMSGTAILLETLKLRRRWQAWLNQQPSSQEVTQPHQLPETAYIPQINPPTQTETVDSRIE
ncbi:unnamed protein product [Camellia sinensis]